MIFGHAGDERAELNYQRSKQWHDFFPLVPRQITEGPEEGNWVWLQPIQRRAIYGDGFNESWRSWYYRMRHEPQNDGR